LKASSVKCENCIYFEEGGTEYGDGVCHRFPPNGNNITSKAHWCGDFLYKYTRSTELPHNLKPV